MLHQFHQPHPAHQVFGDAVDADYRHFETGNPIGGAEENIESMLGRLTNAISLEEYDIVIGEGTTPIYTLLFYKVFNNWDTDVVPLIADETFLRISQQQTHYLWQNGIGQIMSELVSGVIAVSQLCESWANRYLDSEYHIVHPSIDKQKHGLLKDINQSYEVDSSAKVLHAGSVTDRFAVEKKNVDGLSKVVGERDDWQLRLLGKGHGEFDYSSLPSVTTVGYLEDLSEFAEEYRRADIFVQPSSGDAFPVASLEAMLAGIPTIVSEKTGTKEIVEGVDSNLVCDSSDTGIQSSIEYAIGLSVSERRRIGQELRSQVVGLTEHNQSKHFRRALTQITS